MTPPTDPTARTSPPASGRRAHTIAVTSGKGGVGKTFISANLAAALTRRGQRVLRAAVPRTVRGNYVHVLVQEHGMCLKAAAGRAGR